MSTKRSKRRSFTIHEKRQYVIEMEASGLSVRAFAAKINVNETVIRRWKESMPVFDENIKRSRKMRNKPRKKCGMHPELDIRVLEWVRFRNQKGIRVKDSFIQARAKAMYSRGTSDGNGSWTGKAESCQISSFADVGASI